MDYDKIINLINENNFKSLDFEDQNVKDIIAILSSNKIIDQTPNGIKKIKKQELVVGHLEVKAKFAFIISSVGDFYIKDAKNYFNGDVVIGFKRFNAKENKDEVVIIGLVKREVESLVFKVKEDNKIVSVNQNYDYNFELLNKILLPVNTLFKAKLADFNHNTFYLNFIDTIKVNKNFDEKINEILAVNSVDIDFDQEVLDVVNTLDNQDYQKLERKDLRNLDFITIDGTHSKDLDDAVYLQKEGEYYHLFVSIADVDNFVKTGSIVDKQAMSRGNSVYFLDQVIPMLPVKLSNELCSLNPNVDRYTMTCEMKINKEGEIVEKYVYPSIINSKKRCTYQEVNDYIHRDTLNPDLAPFKNMIDLLDELREILFIKRTNNGSFNFEDQEVYFVIDEKQNIIDIKPIERENGEKLIEEMMIAANESVATIISEMELPFVYRIHDHPDVEQMDNIKLQLTNLGIKYNNKSFEYSNFYAQIVNQIHDELSLAIIDRLLIRSMPKAKYSVNNIGHYGLAITNYTHFTSPIRRYADLMVHRLLKQYLVYHNYDVDAQSVSKLSNTCDYITNKEINAQTSERSIIDLKKTLYIKNFVGQTFKGKISNIYENKIVVELENTIRGSIFLEDYYDFLEVENFKVKFKNKTFSLLDEVEVKVKSVDETKQKIVFVLNGFKRKKYQGFRGKKSYGKKNKDKKRNKSNKYKVTR